MLKYSEKENYTEKLVFCSWYEERNTFTYSLWRCTMVLSWRWGELSNSFQNYGCTTRLGPAVALLGIYPRNEKCAYEHHYLLQLLELAKD